MEEKVLVKSEHYSLKKFLIGVLALTVLASLIWFAVWYVDNVNHEKSWAEDIFPRAKKDYHDSSDSKLCKHFDSYKSYSSSEFYQLHPTFESYAECRDLHRYYTSETSFSGIYLDAFMDSWLLMTLIPLSLNLLTALIWFCMKSYSLTITNKRAYGKANFGIQVDLPMDSISAVATSWLKGISISTPSGRISFFLIKNRDEIHSHLSNLIIERQNKPSYKTEAITTASDYTEELKKIKDLLDAGVITQEEFDTKKKQILGL